MKGLTGQYNHQMDAKGRLRVPAKFRDVIGSDYCLFKGADGCVFIYDRDHYDTIVDKLSSIPESDLAAKRAARLIMMSYVPVTEDNQGRFVLNEKMRDHAGIKKDVVFIGVGNKIELWSAERFAELNLDKTSPESINEAFASLSAYGF